MFKSVYDALIEEGEERGLQKGLQQGLQRLQTAAENCLREGLSIALTAKITGLTEEQVKEIARRVQGK